MVEEAPVEEAVVEKAVVEVPDVELPVVELPSESPAVEWAQAIASVTRNDESLESTTRLVTAIRLWTSAGHAVGFRARFVI